MNFFLRAYDPQDNDQLAYVSCHVMRKPKTHQKEKTLAKKQIEWRYIQPKPSKVSEIKKLLDQPMKADEDQLVIKTAAKKAIEAALRKKRLRKLRKDQAKVTKVGVQLTSSMNRKARMKFVGSEVPRAVYPRIRSQVPKHVGLTKGKAWTNAEKKKQVLGIRNEKIKQVAMLKDLKTKLQAHKKSIDKLKVEQEKLEKKSKLELAEVNRSRARIIKEIKWMKSYKKKTGSWPEDKWYKDISKKKWRR